MISKSQKYKKTIEILIYTDGYSHSATSIIIKETPIKGGAIIVRYSGNPKIQESFDSSQNPSPVFNTDGMEDDLLKKIKNLGFSLGYPIWEMFYKLDHENETNIPLEYKINPIELRYRQYNRYEDGSYDDFIQVEESIFKIAETTCNSNNKKLLLINEECKFTDVHIHGVYECSEEGT